jgi:hypothetical protein
MRKVPIEVQIDLCEDYLLIVYTNHFYYELPQVPIQVIKEIRQLTWNLQDGYGTPGHNPPQGWDWSGIRDSSPQAHQQIAQSIRTILHRWGFNQITVIQEQH